MKVALLQLSDIHIDSVNNFVFKHKEEFWRSCKHLINECTKLVIVITGDIAYHGTKEEYDLAYNWLKDCEEYWKSEARFLNSIEYIMVPGNHDCYFENNPIRDIVIEKILQNDVLNEEQLAVSCLSVQKNFWDFYKKFRSDVEIPEVSWSHCIKIKIDLNLKFCCYNTAFVSQITEAPGCLFIPENKFISVEEANKNDVVISLFHHNTGWLTPQTPHNKKSFEQHLYSNSNIVMCGHEHSERHQYISNMREYKEIIYLENSAFQNGDSSEYGLLLFDTDDNTVTSFSYCFDGEIYKENEESVFPIYKKQTGILLNKGWEEKLYKHNIPLKHARKDNLLLSDIFVYPDLEPLSDDNSKYVQYITSEDLIDDTISERIIILEGENQSGKSSLLQMFGSSEKCVVFIM